MLSSYEIKLVAQRDSELKVSIQILNRQMFNLRCVTNRLLSQQNPQLFKYFPLLSKICLIFPPKPY